MKDGEEVLDILARDPHTAHHISFEIAQRFVSDDPPAALVDRMAETFLKTDGDIREVLHTMIYSPEFWSKNAYRTKIKTPFELVVSATRAVGADSRCAPFCSCNGRTASASPCISASPRQATRTRPTPG